MCYTAAPLGARNRYVPYAPVDVHVSRGTHKHVSRYWGIVCGGGGVVLLVRRWPPSEEAIGSWRWKYGPRCGDSTTPRGHIFGLDAVGTNFWRPS
jgi:hypothetical protein